MNDLITNYSTQELITFLVVFAIAFKAVVSFFEWLYHWLREKFGKKDPVEDMEGKVNKLFAIQEEQDEQMKMMRNAIDILLSSDKNSIKSWIVEKHHHFCYEIKAIDYFSLKSIERRYELYQQESGNSYIATLMEELKALPKIETSDIIRTKTKYEQSLESFEEKKK